MAVAPIAPHTAQDIFNHLPQRLKKAFHVDFPNQKVLLGERKISETLDIRAVSREGEFSIPSESGLATSAPEDQFVFAQGWLRAKDEWSNEAASKTVKLVRQARLGVSKCIDTARASRSKKSPPQTKASVPEKDLLYINSPLAAKVRQALKILFLALWIYCTQLCLSAEVCSHVHIQRRLMVMFRLNVCMSVVVIQVLVRLPAGDLLDALTALESDLADVFLVSHVKVQVVTAEHGGMEDTHRSRVDDVVDDSDGFSVTCSHNTHEVTEDLSLRTVSDVTVGSASVEGCFTLGKLLPCPHMLRTTHSTTFPAFYKK